MEKRNSINTAFLLAFIFFIITFLLDTLLFCCEPLQRPLRMMFNSDVLKDEKLSGITIIISVISHLITLLPKCILAFYNLSKKDMQKQRGLLTIILTAAFTLLSSVISVAANLIIGMTASQHEYYLLSTLSRSYVVTGLFSSAATIILYCCGAIEMYNGTEKNIYPPLNDTDNNSENTLS